MTTIGIRRARTGARLALFTILLSVSAPAVAQESDAMTDGIMAFREERFDDAVRAFERAVAQDPANAEAHFLLARLYFETPLRDVKRAGRELDRALEIDPDNVQYLVARLEHMRVDANNFIVEKIREERRRRLALRILQMDSTNAFAHEELGISHIRDFWRYRNAVSIPTLKLANPEYDLPIDENIDAALFDTGIDPTDESLLTRPIFGNPVGGEFDLGALNVDDEFNLDRFASQGYPVQDLSKRARKAYASAIFHLERSIESDPRRHSVYENLLRVHALNRDSESALELLSRMFQYFPDDAFMWANLGYAHFRSANVAAAAVSFNKALELMPEAERAAYESIGLILPPEEEARYRQNERAYAARFWTSKDPRYLTTANERKLEHYSRIVYADLLYAAPDIKKRGWETDRGKIIIRYGVPQADVMWMATGSTNDRALITTAVYGAGEATQFSADMVAETNRYNIWEYGDFRFVFEDPLNNGRFLFYSPSASDISTGRFGDAWINDYELKARETFRKYPDAYNFEPPGRRVELPFLVSSFRGQDGPADVFVHYGIPVTEFDPSQGLVEVTANVGTFLVNSNRDLIVERRKTLYGLSTSQIMSFDDLNLWVSSERVSAPSGTHEVSMEFETAAGGAVAIQRRQVTIPDYETTQLALSDVILSYRIEETPDGQPLGGSDIVRNALSIMPAPWSVFNHQQPIYLYFEVYNLQLGGDGRTSWEVEARLSPKDEKKGLGGLVRGIFGGGDKGVSVTTPVAGTTPDDNQYLILDAATQPTGLYTLRLRVKDVLSGKSVEKSTDLFLE